MLLATIAHEGIYYEIHGEPERTMCRLNLLRGDGQPMRDRDRRVPREDVEAEIRRWHASALPGATLVLAPALTRALLDRQRRLGAAPPRANQGSFGDYGARRIEDVPGEEAIVASARRPRHPAADLLGEDET
jgi:hypothetical protein